MKRTFRALKNLWILLTAAVACWWLDTAKFRAGLIGQVSVAAATAVTGYDLFRDQTWRVSSKPRRLFGLMVAGSTAGGDCSFDLFVDQYHIGRFFNSAAGWPTHDHLIPLKGNAVPPGATIAAIMITAPTANPINVILL